MNDLSRSEMAERYRIAVMRFDCLWNRSVSGVAAEMGELLKELQDLELVLFRGDRFCRSAGQHQRLGRKIDAPLSQGQ